MYIYVWFYVCVCVCVCFHWHPWRLCGPRSEQSFPHLSPTMRSCLAIFWFIHLVARTGHSVQQIPLDGTVEDSLRRRTKQIQEKSRDNNDVDAAASFGAILKCLDRVQFAFGSYTVCDCACAGACVSTCVSSYVCVSYFARFCVACFSVYLGHCLSLLPSQGFRQTKATATAKARAEVEATPAAETSPEGQKKQPKGFQFARDLLWLWLPYWSAAGS